MVSTSLIDPGFLTLRGIAQLRAQVDLLLAAIEGDGRFSAVHTNARDTYLARFLRKWGGGFAPGQLLGELREIGLERRCELQGTPALFKRRRDATAGITDYAWLVARGHLPVLGLDSGCGGLGERTNTHSRGRPTPRRRTLEELLEGLCGGRTKRSDAVRLRIGPKILQIGEPEIWTAVRDLCGLSSRRVDHPTTITRPVLTTSTWDRGDLGSIFEPVRGKWSANMGERQILELFLDSWLTAESVITSTALARAGISRGPEGLIHYYIRRWRASGHLGRALQRACEVESEEPRRTFLSQVLAVVP